MRIIDNTIRIVSSFFGRSAGMLVSAGLSRNILLSYSFGVGALLSVNLVFLALEPHHAAERNVHLLDALTFFVLNASVLACSLWLNVRLFGTSVRVRIFANVLSYFLLSGVSISLHFPVWQLLTHGPPIGFYIRDEFARNLLLFCMSMIVARTLEVSEQHQSMKAELAAVRQESLLGQIESLKQQINPHFFFNSLNTLSGLAREDADKTIEFIEKLSQVFRTVLEIQQKDMVSLGEELEFAGAFLYLLNVRFEGKFICEIASEPTAEAMLWLPPLSSQLLLENVVKHNRMTRQNPVRVKMFVEFRTLESAYFVVENSYAPLKNSSGTRTGLANLTKRSELLTDKPVVIEQDASIFRVKVPLSKGSKNESRFTRR
jgi:sensor histidine kinase YesM